MLILTGPLVGLSFISAVRVYGEASGVGGTASGVGEAFSPLTGVWAPTFSAFEIIAAFLLPFVVIQLVSGDRQSGALKIELQRPLSPILRVGAKVVVLGAAWLVCLTAGVAGVILWRSYGGAIYPPELAAVVLGTCSACGLTVALAWRRPAWASVERGDPTLAVTVGSWVVNFLADVHGGAWNDRRVERRRRWWRSFSGVWCRSRAARGGDLIAAGLGGTDRMRLGVPVRRRSIESACLVAARRAHGRRGPDDSSWDLRGPAHRSPKPTSGRSTSTARWSSSRIWRPRTAGARIWNAAPSPSPARDAAPAHPIRIGDLDWLDRANQPALRRDHLRVERPAGNEPPDDGRSRARDHLRFTSPRRSTATRSSGHPLPVTPRGAANPHIVWPALTFVAVNRFQALMNVASSRASRCCSQVRLPRPILKWISAEAVGKPPRLEPMVGTWVVSQDGPDKVVEVDGRPWVAAKDNPTRLLIQTARRLYGTTNEELMDNAKQFAYYPVAVLKSVQTFSTGAIAVKFKTIAGDADRASGILFNVKPNGDWLCVPQRFETNVRSGSSTTALAPPGRTRGLVPRPRGLA
jgi:hypothetical protein